MANFNFRGLQPSADKVVPYRLYQIEAEEPPVLHMKQATEANKPYWNGVLRRNSGTARRLRGGKLTQAVIDETRESDRELFSRHVITGWDHVVDENGARVEFSPEECLNFLRALPPWLFDEIRGHASDVQNFIGEVIDEEAVSGN